MRGAQQAHFCAYVRVCVFMYCMSTVGSCIEALHEHVMKPDKYVMYVSSVYRKLVAMDELSYAGTYILAYTSAYMCT